MELVHDSAHHSTTYFTGQVKSFYSVVSSKQKLDRNYLWCKFYNILPLRTA